MGAEKENKANKIIVFPEGPKFACSEERFELMTYPLRDILGVMLLLWMLKDCSWDMGLFMMLVVAVASAAFVCILFDRHRRRPMLRTMVEIARTEYAKQVADFPALLYNNIVAQGVEPSDDSITIKQTPHHLTVKVVTSFGEFSHEYVLLP